MPFDVDLHRTDVKLDYTFVSEPLWKTVIHTQAEARTTQERASSIRRRIVEAKFHARLDHRRTESIR